MSQETVFQEFRRKFLIKEAAFFPALGLILGFIAGQEQSEVQVPTSKAVMVAGQNNNDAVTINGYQVKIEFPYGTQNGDRDAANLALRQALNAYDATVPEFTIQTKSDASLLRPIICSVATGVLFSGLTGAVMLSLIAVNRRCAQYRSTRTA